MIQTGQNDKGYYDISGYVNAVGRESRPITEKRTGAKFVEMIVPGTFKKALNRDPTVAITTDINHGVMECNPPVPLPTKKVELYEDSIGLYADVIAAKEDVDKQTDINSLQGWSFDFIPHTDAIEWSYNSKGMPLRIINDLDLRGISIIGANYKGRPCYEGTSIETRGDGKIVCWTRPSNVFGQIKAKKVFFNSDDMKKIRAESTPSIETNSSYEPQKVADLRRTLISEIFKSINQRRK